MLDENSRDSLRNFKELSHLEAIVQMSILRSQNLRPGLGIMGKENSEVHLNALVIVI
jgi:hypothetical protein